MPITYNIYNNYICVNLKKKKKTLKGKKGNV